MSNTSIQPAAAGGTFAGLQATLAGFVPPTATLALTGAAPSIAPSLAGPCKQTPGLSGGLYAAYNVVGALLVKSGSAILTTINCVSAGTITVHDATSAAACVSGNQIGAFVMTNGTSLALNWPCAAGLYVKAVSAGAFSLSFT